MEASTEPVLYKNITRVAYRQQKNMSTRTQQDYEPFWKRSRRGKRLLAAPCLSVRPFVYMEQFCSQRTDFQENLIL